MAIVFSCACGQKYSVAEALAGKSGRCKKCGATMRIPRVAAEAAGAPAFAAEEEPARVAVTVRPAEPAADEAPDPDGPEGPAWFQGYLSPGNRPRDCSCCACSDFSGERSDSSTGSRSAGASEAASR